MPCDSSSRWYPRKLLFLKALRNVFKTQEINSMSQKKFKLEYSSQLNRFSQYRILTYFYMMLTLFIKTWVLWLCLYFFSGSVQPLNQWTRRCVWLHFSQSLYLATHSYIICFGIWNSIASKKFINIWVSHPVVKTWHCFNPVF